MMRTLCVLTAFFALSAGCASAPVPKRATELTTEALCLPPDVSPSVFTWPVQGGAPIRIPTEDGTEEAGVVLRYSQGSLVISAVWTRLGLISLDAAPDDPKAPAWGDVSLVTPDGRLRTARRGACRWERIRADRI
jgi:hypothetical protein